MDQFQFKATSYRVKIATCMYPMRFSKTLLILTCSYMIHFNPLYIFMEYSFWFDTINLEESIIRIGYSMFCVGYGIYTRERSSRVYIS